MRTWYLVAALACRPANSGDARSADVGRVDARIDAVGRADARRDGGFSGDATSSVDANAGAPDASPPDANQCLVIDDNNPCTFDSCPFGAPVHEPAPEGWPCSLGACDGDGECVAN